MRKILRRSAVVLAIALGGVGIVAVPASAHAIGYDLCQDWCTIKYGYIDVSSDHHKITVCDSRADGLGVHVEFYVSPSNGGDEFYKVIGDPDGKGGVCGSYSTGGTIHSFRGFVGPVSDDIWPWVTVT